LVSGWWFVFDLFVDLYFFLGWVCLFCIVFVRIAILPCCLFGSVFVCFALVLFSVCLGVLILCVFGLCILFAFVWLLLLFLFSVLLGYLCVCVCGYFVCVCDFVVCDFIVYIDVIVL